MSPRHSDTGSGWIKRRFLKIEKELREQRASKRAQGMTVGKGGITIKEGGSFRAKYPASAGGADATTFGPLPGSGAGSYVLELRAEDGTGVFSAIRIIGTDENPAGLNGIFTTGIHSLVTPTGAGSIFMNDSTLSLSHTGGVYISHSTTGASANCFIDPSDSRIWRSTSSRRYKQDFEDVEINPADVLKMQPRTWRDKGEVETNPDTKTRYIGFIAEELHDIGLSQFVNYNAEGQPDAISYDRLSVALLAVLKDQEKRIAALERDTDRQQPEGDTE